jgi:hypothetical protein
MNAITLIAPKKSDLKIFVDLAKKLNISARFIESSENGEIEEVEDWELLAQMLASKQSGIANNQDVLKELGFKQDEIPVY